MVVKIDAEVNYLSTFMRYDMILSSEIDAIQIRTPVKIKAGLESGVWNRESVESGVWSLESGVLSLESGVGLGPPGWEISRFRLAQDFPF